MISEKILLGCRSREQDAQRQLYAQTSEMVMCVCKRYSNSQSKAEDMFQEAFLHIFKNIDKFDISRGLQLFSPWLRRVVANVALLHLRSENKFITDDIEDASDDLNHSSFQDIDMELDIEKVLIYLQQLPLLQKSVFNLYAIEGYPHNEIATLLDITPATSRSYLNRARKRLSKFVQEIGVFE